MIPVKGYIGLYRDEDSNAIINTNDSVYNEYIKSKSRLIENQEKLNMIENELAEIKTLLKSVLEK